MQIESLTSAANPLIKEIRRAGARGALTRDGYAIAESLHLLDEAIRSGCDIGAIVMAESALPQVEARLGGFRQVRRVALSDRLFDEISVTGNSQGVMVLVRPPAWNLEDLFRATPLLTVLEGIQDPGNAGAIVRAAEAFGGTGIVFLKGSVSPYNPKAVRASAGSLFRVPVVTGLDAEGAGAALEAHGLAVYAAMPAAPRSIEGADFTRACAFLIGSEGRGLSATIRARAAELRIPVSGVESLNAAMAAGVLLYEARRQRSGR